MPTRGGRTTHRVAADLFKTTPIKQDKGTAIGGGRVDDYLCVQACSIFCKYRKDVIDELIKDRPDLADNIFREALTDIQTASDILGGGSCECTCNEKYKKV